MKTNIKKLFTLLSVSVILASCDNNDDSMMSQPATITVENVLDSKPLVESGTFQGTGTPPVILPGQSVSFSFYAGKNQALTFASMYGWSNDLFFAPANPGIKLYNADGTPVTGDVSSQIKLWDNGSRINQTPGMSVSHPGVAEAAPKNVQEVNGIDAYGHSYLPASQLMKVSLAYNGNSKFTITIMNNSGGTANETPFSPGVWAVSYAIGTNLLSPEPIYKPTALSANGLTELSEMGNITILGNYLKGMTGIFTPLSPVLVVVYEGNANPFYKTGENDRGKGLKQLSQMGNADILAAALKNKAGVKAVYVLKEPANMVLLPKINGATGGKVSQQLSLQQGDKIAVATMYGFSTDWFFATKDGGISATQRGDLSSSMGLFDNGTAVNQYPGEGVPQAAENLPIQAVPNPNFYNTLPAITDMIKVTLQ